MAISLPKEFFETEEWIKFNEPIIDFNIGTSTNINSPIVGIQKEGPFDYNIDQRYFNKLKFIVMSPNDSNYQTKLVKILEIIKNGQGYFRGIETEFKLIKVFFPSVEDYYSYEIDSKRSIEDTVDRIVKDNPNIYSKTSDTVPFVLVAGPDYRMFRDTPNYDECKKELLRAGFPNQYLSDYASENKKNRGILNQAFNSNVVYGLWNTLVSIYTKAGGIPWTLKNTLKSSTGAPNVEKEGVMKNEKDR